MVYQTEKLLKEHGDKVGPDDKARIESALAGVRQVQQGSDKAQIEKALEELTQASHRLAEAMYKQSQEPGAAPGGADSAKPSGAEAGGGAVEADYEVLDEEKKP